MGAITAYEKTRERIRKLNLTSDIFIGKVVESPAVLEELLYLITGRSFHINDVRTQYSIRQLLRHSVVLDIYADTEEGCIIHMEVENKTDDNHVKRVLYCRSSIIVSLLDTGLPYQELPELFQIFISRKDFLHTGKAVVYNQKPYPDGVSEIYFNLAAANGTRIPLRKLQKYFTATIPENESSYFPKLVDRVNFLKYQKKGVSEMCEIFDEVRQEGRAEGREEGRAEGRNEGRTEAWQETILDLLHPLGFIPKNLRQRIRAQNDETCLRSWIQTAAHVTSIDDFASKL